MARASTDPLSVYRAKRDFKITGEPAEGGVANETARAFVIQKHWATRLHYDLRLELDGTMRSWAVPKGPSFDPADKRMAVQVEDHPIAYNQFEGDIPKGQYGAGTVIIWDEGTWTPVGDPREGLEKGHLKFDLDGYKMKGRFALVKMKNAEGSKPVWLLIKDRDAHARPRKTFDVVQAMPDSVVPLRSVKKKSASASRAAPATRTSAAAPATEGTPVGKTAAKKTAVKKTVAKKAVAKKAATKETAKREAATKQTTAKQTAAKKTAAKKTAAKQTATKKTTAKQTATKKASAKASAAGELAQPARAVSHRVTAAAAGVNLFEDPASGLPGKGIRSLPDALPPQLATLVDRAPADPENWIYEIKFDGYRLTARIDPQGVKLFTRNGHDWTGKLAHIARALTRLDLDLTWLDGEIVVLNDKGAPDFGALQNAFDNNRTSQILYYVFDAPIIAGRDVRGEPLTLRRGLLEQAVRALDADGVRFSEAFDVPPDALVKSACQMGLEGVIAKQRNAVYVSRRAPTWIKLKCTRRQEFVVVGYTQPKGSRAGLGALLLAVHDDDGELRYVGNVGSGFNEETLASVTASLKKVQTQDAALKVPADAARGATWVSPSLVAEVSFSDWTSAGRIRHGVFRGLRVDKPADAITREQPVSVDAAAGRSASSGQARKSSSTGKLTHPERVIDPSTGLTKLDLVTYYADVADLMRPHLDARPVSFLRAPQGVEGQQFFQKHLEHAMPGVKALPRRLDPGHPSLVEVPTAQAILSAAQMNVVEFHTWNAVKTAIGKPDRMTFDLDPGEGVPWATVQKAAQLVKVMLDALSLAALIKTSGGKGLHVVVPLRKQYDWDTVKGASQAIVQHLAKTIPDIFVSKSGPKNRVGKVFVDYLRNGFGATTVSAWSARARPGLGVSVPIDWDELPDMTSGAHWNITNVAERFKTGNAPWEGARAQPLTPVLKWLEEK